MRLAAQAKMGFYPVTPSTVAFVCKALTINDPSKVRIIDPCCGSGLALRDFGQHLSIPKENLYGIELDERRAEQAAEHAQVVQGSFFNTRIVPVKAFSMAWVNPPYENELKQEEAGGRQLEVSFLQYIQRYVESGGLIVLHMPADRIDDTVTRAFHQICFDVRRIILPPEMRPYRETLLVGCKRSTIETHVWNTHVTTTEAMPATTLVDGTKLKAFSKTAPTDSDITQCLVDARFWKVFRESKVKPKLKPVLPLGPGHLGLTLASGYLDGLLCPKDAEPHVVRGVAYKEDVLAKEEESESDEGKVTQTKTYRQNIKLKIRAITGDGTIHEMK